MKFTPTGDRLLLEPAPSSRGETVVVLPDSLHKPVLDRWSVCAVGRDAHNTFNFWVGDEVVITEHSGFDLVLDGLPRKLVRATEVLAIIKK